MGTDGTAAGRIQGDRLLFVGGLHRNGTTPFAKTLAAHPRISGLSATGVPEDEGQHLQDVYPTAHQLGGMGRFARSTRAHLTERSPLVSTENADRILDAWAPFWDVSRPVLLEKSPPNMIMGRFLQAMFPGSALVVVMRHPIVAALALEKWNPRLIGRSGRWRTSLLGRVEHWTLAYDIFLDDARFLPRSHLLRYEDLVSDPTSILGEVQSFLDLPEPFPAGLIRNDLSGQYEDRWLAMAHGNPIERRARRRIIEEFGPAIAKFGYDAETLGYEPDWQRQG